MNEFHRKLYALLHELNLLDELNLTSNASGSPKLACFTAADRNLLQNWWDQQQGQLAEEIAATSDRLNLKALTRGLSNSPSEVCHPISGQRHSISVSNTTLNLPGWLTQVTDPKIVFVWFWRFYPDLQAQQNPDSWLLPSDPVMPDCPRHSYASTVSALTGAMFPKDWQQGDAIAHPYLILFTFSPVQEFVKSSRKQLDFWSGSYMLHYLSATLCWEVAGLYGPDAVITPSLWNQEIIDALLFQKYPELISAFHNNDGSSNTISNWLKESSSLRTAGFPNIITAVVPGQDAAKQLGSLLKHKLRQSWCEIGAKIKQDIKQRVTEQLKEPEDYQRIWANIKATLAPGTDVEPYVRDLKQWQQDGCWEWNKLWDAQLQHTWESYWTAIPLGAPHDEGLSTAKTSSQFFDWKQAQQQLAQSPLLIPTTVEEALFDRFNVGTWWGSLQARLGKAIQAAKNTRNWQLPASPGERSTISGQFSAVHPRFHYDCVKGQDFREGGGLPAGSMRLFWLLMAEVYPGLFNGSEKLNAIELTKRMAWAYGGVAEFLGIDPTLSVELPADELEAESEGDAADDLENDLSTKAIDPEQLIRFPNASSIAAARFAYENPQWVRKYWYILNGLIKANKHNFRSRKRRGFYRRTLRSFQIPKTDRKMQAVLPDRYNRYNGVMFSSKWLADDMGLQGADVNLLRSLVDKAHQTCQLKDGSPADWWVLVLADGDGMGQYVNGKKLKEYQHYVAKPIADGIEQIGTNWKTLLQATKKRMGPATHIGLNRALLDFSNRLVPYLTQERFCGRVIYSGGDDVMAALPLEDLPEFLLSLRSAWCGNSDPSGEFANQGGYWQPKPGTQADQTLGDRPFFTMGEEATMSLGIVIAHKSIPLPTVLEHIWQAEKERAKKLVGKDGLCFRVIYGSGNTLEALMKGSLLSQWWQFMELGWQHDISPVLHRLADELPRHAALSSDLQLICKAAKVILESRDRGFKEIPEDCDPEIREQIKQTHEQLKQALLDWLKGWEHWAWQASKQPETSLGTTLEDLSSLLRFSAFWADKRSQRLAWAQLSEEAK